MKKLIVLMLFASIVLIWYQIASRFFFSNSVELSHNTFVHSTESIRKFTDLRYDSLHSYALNPFEMNSGSNSNVEVDLHKEERMEKRTTHNAKLEITENSSLIDYRIDFVGFVKNGSKKEVKGIFEIERLSSILGVGDSIRDYKIVFIDEKNAILDSKLYGKLVLTK